MDSDLCATAVWALVRRSGDGMLRAQSVHRIDGIRGIHAQHKPCDLLVRADAPLADADLDGLPIPINVWS